MAAKGLYIEKMFCRFVGKPCRLKISSFIPKLTQFIVEYGIIPEQYGLTVDKKELFKTLRIVYPEEFGADIDKYMDRIDGAVARYHMEKIRNRTKTDEWHEGYNEAIEIMHMTMNEITKELKNADKG